MAEGADGGKAVEGGGSASRLAPFNPTSEASIDAALELLQVKEGESVLDVGCGDGRLLIACAQRVRCSGVGIEWDATLAEKARGKIEAEALGDRVRVVCGDATVLDWGEPDVIFLYLVPDGLRRISPLIHKHLLRGARVATNIFSLPNLVPTAERTVGPVKVRLYTADSLPTSAPTTSDGVE
jgi:precorrin-6B methylase 2